MKTVFHTTLLASTPAPKNISATYGVSIPGRIGAVLKLGEIDRMSCG